VISRWRRLAAEALDRRFGPLNARLDRSDARIAELEAVLGRQSADLERALAVLRSLAADDPDNRRRLAEARAAADYPAPWEEDDPLVSVVIPTRNRPRLLVERSLPSILAQTHENLEVLVMGDAAGPEIAEAVASVGDPRVRFVNMTHRYERPDGDTWLTAGTLTRNEGYRLAGGLWLAEADDDDALRPHAIAALIAHARRHRLEVAYGRMAQHLPDGSTTELGSFPPRLGNAGWQAAIVHGALRFFAREHIAADLSLPGDWFRMERMLRAGVRFGHLEQVLGDYYPAQAWRPG
jgi:hypothetical protein